MKALGAGWFLCKHWKLGGCYGTTESWVRMKAMGARVVSMEAPGIGVGSMKLQRTGAVSVLALNAGVVS